MKATVTLKLKLEMTEQIANSLSETQKAYVVALNHTSEAAFEKQVFKSVALQHITYRDVREATKLPANLVRSSRNVVADGCKLDKDMRHRWKETAAMRYDTRTLTVKLDREYVTHSALDGRAVVNRILSVHNRRYIDGTWEIEPTATISRKSRVRYPIVTKDIPDSQSDTRIGADSGVVRIATFSAGKVFNGVLIKHIRDRRFKQRRDLQSERRKSLNQRLFSKWLVVKEKRPVEWLLSNVANAIVNEALKADACTMAFEDFKGVRTRILVAKKRRLIHYGRPLSSLFLKIARGASKHGVRMERGLALATRR